MSGAYGGMQRVTVQAEMQQTIEQLRRTIKLRDKTISDLRRDVRLLTEQLEQPAAKKRGKKGEAA